MEISYIDKKALRPAPFYVLLLVQLTLAVGGIQGGWRLISDPTGRSLGIPSEILTSLPLTSFEMPGTFILVMFGLVPLFLGIALWVRLPWPLAERTLEGCPYHWAWAASVGLCTLLLFWTGILFCLLGYRIYYQLIDGLMALVLLNLLLLPSVRQAVPHS
ncbi:hypothetical protein [Larkinella soli]|uniref:hypothetical protein n=1 Tax=Larkinella soli TaxID=1770527 RepID=UPI000FFB8DB1|nr:hypothetical protein [Larkinella soli]